ncbi:hypothetical protein Rsub_03363 [Raphidocelis subcapitata]|uniref:Mechanosensitive ion channel MscS domain-containing protein n=1 Tax=Raphidocelis subcapitata TaxID=307507 RepID=A0A2V0NXC3_9CHLO|nr:hypothetical protein Rsub_03363 [Raphidocelis subcapitata]|eukprot:GBF90230.1 hypothetical protein Rsub_03363 [Raphidocelis subcapitata]
MAAAPCAAAPRAARGSAPSRRPSGPVITPPRAAAALRRPAPPRRRVTAALEPAIDAAAAAAAAAATAAAAAAAGTATAAATAAAETVAAVRPLLSDMFVAAAGVGAGGATLPLLQLLGFDFAAPLAALALLLRAIDAGAARAKQRMEARAAGEGGGLGMELQGSVGTLINLALLALRAPAAFVLPLLVGAHVLRVALATVDLLLASNQLPPASEALLLAISAQRVPLDRALSIAADGLVTVFSAWLFVALKDATVTEVLLARTARGAPREVERVLLPLSALLTWAVALAAGFALSAAAGLDLRPALAVGGAGGIAAGFASQQVLQNLVSGVNIFLTRPFVVGEQVVIAGAGLERLEGVVEDVQTMRTLLRNSEGFVVAVPNYLVADCVVFNRSRSLVPPSSPTAISAALRVLAFTIKLPREMEDRVDEARAAVSEVLSEIALAERAALMPWPAAAASSDGDGDGDGGEGEGEGAGEEGRGEADAAQGDERGAEAEAAAQAEAEAEEGEEAEAEEGPEPEPPRVSVALRRLTDDTVELFAKCELLFACSSPDEARRKVEGAILRVSGLVRRDFGGVVVTDGLLM